MFRFTIRDVLWLTVVVGLGVRWWLDETASGEKEIAKHSARSSARACSCRDMRELLPISQTRSERSH